ncbi:PREDICTED: organic solute transporter subunit beta [Condylura cristata]|uniref:organic solute transporter subunit beta n=1 Tax=Condylura cristata TaxID=143302 RepID=UPI0003347DA9|nr:PREDICTED: organic solute transporter subunit beta [Condylura cristata]
MEAAAGTEVPQELLEEMLWVFRVQDAAPWNYSILVLMFLVVTISIVLLGWSIRQNRNKKMMRPEKQTPKVPCSDEADTKDNNSQNLVTETLLSAKPKESNVSSISLPEPQEFES